MTEPMHVPPVAADPTSAQPLTPDAPPLAGAYVGPAVPPAGDRGRIAAPRFDAKAFDDRAKAFGKEAEAAADRFARDPSVLRAADVGRLAMGGLILVIGSWFLADVTLGMDLPAFPWAEIWPLALIVLGLAVVAGAAGRRRA